MGNDKEDDEISDNDNEELIGYWFNCAGVMGMGVIPQMPQMPPMKPTSDPSGPKKVKQFFCMSAYLI